MTRTTSVPVPEDVNKPSKRAGESLTEAKSLSYCLIFPETVLSGCPVKVASMSIQCRVTRGVQGFVDVCGTYRFGCVGCSLNKGAQSKRHPHLPTRPSTWQSHVHLEEAMAFSNLPKGFNGPV